MKLQEVEIRAILDSNQKDVLKEILEKKKFKFSRTEHIKDDYFCSNEVKEFKEIEMDSVGSFSLRLRRIVVGTKAIVEMNTKVISSAGDHSAWDEHEIEVHDYNQSFLILKTLGFKKFFKLDKKRDLFIKKPFSVFIEDIKDFGLSIEIEIMSPKKEVKKAKEKIYKLLKELGVSNKQIVQKSVTNVLMRERSIF